MKPILAIEGGASRSRIGLYDGGNVLLGETETGPSNPTEDGLAHTASRISRAATPLLEQHELRTFKLAAGIAGAGFGLMAKGLAAALLDRIPASSAIVSHDLAPILVANFESNPGMLVIAGTGSSILVQGEGAPPTRIGGRGPLFAEIGSAYAIARRALRLAANAVDGVARDTSLVHELVDAAGLERFDDFVPWQRSASKSDIAALAQKVDTCASDGDESAQRCIEKEANSLARLAGSAAERHGLPGRVRVVTHGGVFVGSKMFRAAFRRRLLKSFPKVSVDSASVTGHAAVLRMARRCPDWVPEIKSRRRDIAPVTEQRLLTERTLDVMEPGEIATVMSEEDRHAADAVHAARSVVAEAIAAAANAFTADGRLIYVGAGTSGRLGVLDASECPPTFNAPKTQVVGIIAGGEKALSESVEGAEDDAERARLDLGELDPPLSSKDFLVGISASGTAPYVLSAIETARGANATSAMVCCNPRIEVQADIVIALETGPEVLPGSTRLKAGTATKMVLNQISTGGMALSGRVFDGYMVGAQPVNAKLRKRAAGIVAALTEIDEASAAKLLAQAGDRISVAVIMRRTGTGAQRAVEILEEHRGNLRAALLHIESDARS